MAKIGVGKVILCVDDEAVGLSVRKMTLESQGYRVFTAENGPDCLAIFSAERVDLVVLDYKMPGMNGDIVAERMKGLKVIVPARRGAGRCAASWGDARSWEGRTRARAEGDGRRREEGGKNEDKGRLFCLPI